MKMTKFLKTLTASTILLWATLTGQVAFAETAVIVHPSNGDVITAKDIERLYLGKLKAFPGGAEAIPVDQNKGEAIREAFYNDVLGKNEQQVKAYWARLVFTGKGTPPKEIGDSAAVKSLVAQNPNTIGYIDASVVDGSVKVVHKF